MRRNDTEFKAEIFRRYDIHKKKQRKKYIMTGSSCAAVMLCAALTLPFLTGMTTEESAPPLTQIENATIATTTESIAVPDTVKLSFGEKTWEFSGEDAKAVMEYLTENRRPDYQIFTYGNATTTEATTSEATATTGEMTDAAENGNYLLTAYYQMDTATVITAESATIFGTQNEKNENSKTYILTEIYWDFKKLETFLDDLKNGESKEGDTP